MTTIALLCCPELKFWAKDESPLSDWEVIERLESVLTDFPRLALQFIAGRLVREVQNLS